jgi:sugar/nucleoside kinase (ribokinase family)
MLSLGEEYYLPILKAADVVVFNQVEAAGITGKQEPDEAAKTLVEMGIPVPVITLGKKGAIFAADGVSTLVPAQPVKQVVDTTGAGDAFSVGLLAGILEGFSWQDTIQLGSQVAAYKIQHHGARKGLPYRDQIAALKTREGKYDG